MTCSEVVKLIVQDKFNLEYLNSSSGVYTIKLNNKLYVGSCKLLNNKSSRNGFYYRLYSHIYLLLKGRHHSLKLQNAVNKYGIENIEFGVLQECSNAYTIEAEQFWIDKLETYKYGYNSCSLARSNFGYKHSQESKNKMSASKLGKPSPFKGIKKESLSEETKDKIRLKLKGRTKLPMSTEQKLKISNTLKGLKLTPEQRQAYLKAKELHKGENHWAAKKIYQYTLQGQFIKEWKYVKEVEKEGLKYKQVYACLNNTQKTGSGYRWFYSFLGENIGPLFTRKNQFNINIY